MDTKIDFIIKQARKSLENVRILGVLAGVLLALMLWQTAQAIFVSSPQDPLQAGDVTTAEILNDTILGEDISTRASTTMHLLQVTRWLATSTSLTSYTTGSLGAGSTSVAVALGAQGAALISGNLFAGGVIQSTSTALWDGGFTASGSSTIVRVGITGDHFLGDTSADALSVNATSTFASGITAAGGLTVSSGGLSVTNSARITGGLGVGVGTTTAGNVQIAGDVQITGAMSVAGNVSGVVKGIYSAIDLDNGVADRFAMWSSTSTTAANIRGIIPSAGTIRNLRAVVNTPNGNCPAEMVAIYVNGAQSSSTPYCVFSCGNGIKACNDTSTVLSVNAGDYIGFFFDRGDGVGVKEFNWFAASVEFQ